MSIAIKIISLERTFKARLRFKIKSMSVNRLKEQHQMPRYREREAQIPAIGVEIIVRIGRNFRALMIAGSTLKNNETLSLRILYRHIFVRFSTLRIISNIYRNDLDTKSLVLLSACLCTSISCLSIIVLVSKRKTMVHDELQL